MPVRLRKQLLDIADSPLRGATEEARGIAQLLADNYDDLRLRETFADLALQLVVEQPLKTPFVAAVMLVLNTLSHKAPQAQQGQSNGGGEDGGDDTKMEETASEAPKEEPCTALLDDVLARVAAAVEEKVKVGEWRTVKLYLKLLACLSNALDGEGVFPILDALFDRAVELQTASSEDVSGPTTLRGTRAFEPFLTDILGDRRSVPSWSKSFYSQYLTPLPRLLANLRRTQSISSIRRTLSPLSPMRFRL